MITFIEILLFHKYLQLDVATAGGGKAIIEACQVPCHQGKQITGFLEGVFPGNPVTTVIRFRNTTGDLVTVGKQGRVFCAVRGNSRGKFRHHVGPIEIVADTPEAFGFALRAKHLARLVQAFQRGIILRFNGSVTLEGKFQHRRTE